jgi:hypothetical protein
MRFKLNVLRATLCGIVLLPFAISYAQTREDRCDDILQDGVQDEYSDHHIRDVRTAFKYALCSDSEKKTGSDTGIDTGATFPLKVSDITGHGNISRSDVDSLSNKYCDNSDSNLSDADVRNISKRVVSDKIVDKWSQCMTESFQSLAGGLKSEVVVTAEPEILFKARWVPRMNVDSATIEDFYVSGAHCTPELLTVGKPVGTEFLLQHCTRIENKPVLLTLEVVGQDGKVVGSTVQVIPAVIPPPPPRPPTTYAEWSPFPPSIKMPTQKVECGCLKVESPKPGDRNNYPIVNGFNTAPSGTIVKISSQCPNATELFFMQDTRPALGMPPPPPLATAPGRTFALVDLPAKGDLEADISGSLAVFISYLSCHVPVDPLGED